MIIPKKIKIGNHTIRIIQYPRLIVNKRGAIGYFHSESLKIGLNGRYCKSRREEALLHELMHCVDSLYGIGLSEEQTTVLSEAVFEHIIPLWEKKNGHK